MTPEWLYCIACGEPASALLEKLCQRCFGVTRPLVIELAAVRAALDSATARAEQAETERAAMRDTTAKMLERATARIAHLEEALRPLADAQCCKPCLPCPPCAARAALDRTGDVKPGDGEHRVQWHGTFRGTEEDPRECGWCETCGREVYDGDGHGHTTRPAGDQ